MTIQAPRTRRLFAAAALVLTAAVAACDRSSSDEVDRSSEVNVYTHRHYDADQSLFDRFEEETGIRVNVQTASADELITRLETEGADSPADILITVDAGRLVRATDAGLFQAVTSERLDANVPSSMRDPNGHWFGLTQRGRVLVYALDRVSVDDLSTYEDLADPKWRGRILTRSSSNIYNQSLLASLIAAHGADEAEAWARAVVENFARAPQGSDTDQIRDVAAGVGDVAIVNTYYLGRLLNSDDEADRELAGRVGVFFPNQSDRGTHVNVSGAGIPVHAPNLENAIRLLEFLTDDTAQSVFAEANFEYPVKEGVSWAETLQSWGTFQSDPVELATLGALNAEAVRVFDRAGWR